MSRRCELTGIGPMVGHSVSHSNIKTKRRFLPSLKTVKVTSEALGQTFSLRISNAALRTLDYKGGLDVFIVKARSYASRCGDSTFGSPSGGWGVVHGRYPPEPR